METVLQGPDGKPAIDAQSGMPLTMEEMLRRRGINPMGGGMQSYMPPQQAGVPNAATQPPNGGVPTDPSAAPVGGDGSNGGAVSSGGGGAPISQLSTPQADPQATAQQLADSGTDIDTVKTLEAAGLIAAGTAAAYMLYKGVAGRGTSTPASAIDPSAEPIRGRGGITDAEFVPVAEPALPGGASAQALAGRKQAALPAPQKRLPSKPSSQAAAVIEQRSSAPRVAEQPTSKPSTSRTKPRVVAPEGDEAGLARTLGIPGEVLKVLRKNPGIMRTLGRL